MQDTLEEPLEAIRTRLRELGPVLKGSLAEVERTCGSSGCRCQTGGPKHKGYYFSYRAAGKSHTVYVPLAAEAEAKEAHANWLEMKALLEECTSLEVARLRRKARRPGRRPPE